MFKVTKNYVDFDGNEREEDFYFHFSTRELMKMQLTTTEGYMQYLQRITNANNAKELLNTFEDFILKAYGEKSEDGRSFRKGEDISKAFSETQAFEELYMDLAADAEYAAKFFNGVLPKNFDEEVKRLEEAGKKAMAKEN